MTTPWKSIALVGLIALSTDSKAQSQPQNDKLTFDYCHVKGIKQQVKCGTLLVPENYQQESGKDISINFTVLPAIDNSQNKAPMMFLAGGPGQSATSLASGLYRAFNEVRKTRDIILVDQRGTGKSSPLQCDDAVKLDPYTSWSKDFDQQQVKDCLSSFDVDLTQFNSENAIRDFDQVRSALGHEKLAIYGGSYGTRAGLVYMRLFPDSLESVVLDSVGPIEVPIGPFGKSAARSFDMLIENCQAETSCQQAYPNLRADFDKVVAALKETPKQITMPHPRLGSTTTMNLDREKFISTIFMQLYSTETRSLVPLVIHQAAQGNFAPFAGLTAMGDTEPAMYVGLTFNIVCNEDYPKVGHAGFLSDADNTFNQEISHKGWKLACPIWPQYRPSSEFYKPITANIPTLIISGDLDPVTPPSNGDFTDASLPNSKHIVMKHSSHTPGVTPCAVGIINEFINKKDPNDLDETCLSEIPKESFMTSLNGGA